MSPGLGGDDSAAPGAFQEIVGPVLLPYIGKPFPEEPHSRRVRVAPSEGQCLHNPKSEVATFRRLPEAAPDAIVLSVTLDERAGFQGGFA